MTQPIDKAATTQRADVFLSYARVDLESAKTLATALADHGIDVAMDITHLVPGEDYVKRLDALLVGSAKVVFFATKNSIESPACLRELELAGTFAKPVLPVLASGISKDVLPESLREIQYLRQESSDLITQLVGAVQIDLGWERQHTEYEQRAARGSSEVIADRAGIDAAQMWLATRPAGASPVSAPVRALISRSRARLRRRNHSILAAAFVSLAMIGLGAFQYQSRLNEIQLAQAATEAERARADATEAETRARIADAEAEVALARAESAEAETQAARVGEAAAERLANLYRVRAADVLMQEGERGRALQELLDATEGMVGDPDLDSGILDDVLISFERVLEDAFRMRRIGLGESSVAFGPGSDVYLTHQFSGLKRLDLDGKAHEVGMTHGNFIYAQKVLTVPEYPREMVLWEDQNGFYIAEGLDAPRSEGEALAFIPNLGPAESYRNWVTHDLIDGRILIAQSYDQNRFENLNERLDWGEGQYRAAYVFDPSRGALTPVPIDGETRLSEIIQDLEGRTSVFSDDDDFAEEKRMQCARDAPESERYRLAAMALEQVNAESAVGYSHVDCQWHDGALIVATINFASSVYRNAYLFALEPGTDELDAPLSPDLRHSAALDTGETDTFHLWDKVAVFVSPEGRLTMVTYARRTMQVWHDFETHEFALDDDIDRVIALGHGVAGALTKFNTFDYRPNRSLIQFDVRQSFGEYLDKALPPLNPDAAMQNDNRHLLKEPVCVWEPELDRDADGNALWDDPVTEFTYELSPRLFARDEVLCFDPSPALEFLTIHWPHGVELYTYSYSTGDNIFAPVETRISGGAPPPSPPGQSVFNRNTHSIFRTDILPRTNEVGALEFELFSDLTDGLEAIDSIATPPSSEYTVYEILRSRDRILEAQVSPDGTRAVIATGDGSPAVHIQLWSLAAGRLWRDLGFAHRWYNIGFPNNNGVIGSEGFFEDPAPHRILTLEESRLLAQKLLNGD